MKAAASKVIVQYPEDVMGQGLLGYGISSNVVKGIETDIHARAAIFCDESLNYFVFVHLEVGLMFPELKERTINEAGLSFLTPQNTMFVAQHTHSSPGGYTKFPFYNFTITGFRPKVQDALVKAAIEAIHKAYASLKDAEIEQHIIDIDPELPIGYNRSLHAHKQNPGVPDYKENETHLAFERKMDVWNVFDAHTKKTMFQMNWFGMHPTSCGNNFNKICYDNKGFAAIELEEKMGDGFVAIFSQQFTGDVSPNYHGPGQKLIKKPAVQLENAKNNGKLQYQIAAKSFNKAPDLPIGPSKIETRIHDIQMIDYKLSEEFANGEEDAKAVSPAHGMAFIQGTPVDGPGIPMSLGKMASKWFKPIPESNFQYPKVPVLESGTGKIMGTSNLEKIRFIAAFEKTIEGVMWHKDQGLLNELPWTPTYLPIQLVQIGHTVILGFPGEITTQAGRILRDMALNKLKSKGVEKVIVSSYANNYFGYCTTYHEYKVQAYEGGHTVFGRHTHGAFLTAFSKLIDEYTK